MTPISERARTHIGQTGARSARSLVGTVEFIRNVLNDRSPGLYPSVPSLRVPELNFQDRTETDTGLSALPSFSFIAIPPATPTPRTYIHPSWKSNRCELNSELMTF